MDEFPRRDFLKMTTTTLLTTSGLLGLAGLLRYLSYQTDPAPQTEFDLGAVEDFPVGSRTVLPDIPALLIHDESGFSALSLVCTHLGCTVKEKPAEFDFACPCHGSRFDAQGNALNGPAGKALPTLRVETTADGRVRLFLT